MRKIWQSSLVAVALAGECAMAHAATALPVPPCAHLFVPRAQLPRRVDETLRYALENSGVTLGTVDFKITARGNHAGQPTTEYRSLFALDALAAAFVAAQGRAAALVSDTAFWPQRAMNRYRVGEQTVDETFHLDPSGLTMDLVTTVNGKAKSLQRRFSTPAVDFVTAFYLLRRVPQHEPSCALIHGNRRLYTVWLTPAALTEIQTPAGTLPARLMQVQFAAERASRAFSGRIWLSQDGATLPLRAELDAPHTLVATLRRYELGQPPP